MKYYSTCVLCWIVITFSLRVEVLQELRESEKFQFSFLIQQHLLQRRHSVYIAHNNPCFWMSHFFLHQPTEQVHVLGHWRSRLQCGRLFTSEPTLYANRMKQWYSWGICRTETRFHISCHSLKEREKLWENDLSFNKVNNVQT